MDWRIIRAILFYVLLLVIAVVLVGMGMYAWNLKPFADHPHVDLVSGGLGALLGGLLTLILAWVAWLQLGALSGTAQTDSQRASAGFILQLRIAFFTPRTRILFTHIDQGWLIHVRAGGNPEPRFMPFFRVDIEKYQCRRIRPFDTWTTHSAAGVLTV